MKKELAISCVIVLATLAIYAQTLQFDFVNYDDRDHVYENSDLMLGLSPEGVQSALTSIYMGNWAPVTWLSYHADYALHGYDPGGYHLTNMLFHIANALLLLFFLRMATGALWPSAMAALLFALHPLHVESVAWVSERRDVLCTFFSLLTMIAYVHHAKSPSPSRYILVCALLTLSLLSKSMAVTLPCVLMLLDFWPLKQWDEDRPLAALRKSFITKIPMVTLIAAFAAFTFWTQAGAGAVSGVDTFSAPARIANAVIAYGVYIWKTLLPINLLPFYPHPGNDVSLLAAAGTALVLLAISAICLGQRTTRPYLIVGWLWFIGTLVPVIGLVQVGGQAHADRYMYFPMVGLSIAVFWFIKDLTTTPPPRRIATILVVGIMTAYAYAAHVQTARWKDSITLFEYTLLHSPDNPPALINLGEAYLMRDEPDRALPHIEKAWKLYPSDLGNRLNLGRIYRKLNRLPEAEQIFRACLAENKNDATTLTELGVTLTEQKRPDDAVPLLNQAIESDPEYYSARVSRGNALLALNDTNAAIADYEHATLLDPQSPEAYSNLGAAYLMARRFEEAAAPLEKGLSLKPNDAVALVNLAVAKLATGDTDAAISLCRQAIDVDPNYAKAHDMLNALTQPPTPPILKAPSELPGHTWQADDLTLAFQDGGNVLVTGGSLTESMPTGAPARYTLENGAIRLEILGRIYEGTWNGQTLTIGNATGIYMGPNEVQTSPEVIE